MPQGRLILLPNLLDEESLPTSFFPQDLSVAVSSIQGLIAEEEKSARRYLRKFLSHEQMAKTPLRLLNEHTKKEELLDLLAPLKRGECWGLISDAGLACLADPGAEIVWLAHQHQIAVETHVGPSSIIFALQLSGFPGQRFSFHGYLPRESPALEQKIQELEKRSRAEIASQLFIEAPYRSGRLLESLLANLHPSSRLCVAASLCSPRQKVVSQTVEMWKKKPISLEKEPVTFVLSSS